VNRVTLGSNVYLSGFVFGGSQSASSKWPSTGRSRSRSPIQKRNVVVAATEPGAVEGGGTAERVETPVACYVDGAHARVFARDAKPGYRGDHDPSRAGRLTTPGRIVSVTSTGTMTAPASEPSRARRPRLLPMTSEVLVRFLGNYSPRRISRVVHDRRHQTFTNALTPAPTRLDSSRALAPSSGAKLECSWCTAWFKAIFSEPRRPVPTRALRIRDAVGALWRPHLRARCESH
jgi:hypothetical protein